MSDRPTVFVMGVSGTGKTTVGRLLAAALGLPYAEGDDFHPARNVAKMSSGVPLEDADRWPWLDAVGGWVRRQGGRGGVIAASALKRSYRDRLREAAPDALFVHLAGERELIARRMAARSGHFMPAALLDSQYAALEPLSGDERGVTLSVDGGPEETVRRSLDGLRAMGVVECRTDRS
ncbi:gluconokinase [Streptomyces sp. NPDC101118]|uniref:gluconokinase n=1 Tax=Streptomyces sp. NPDC101118 TaxID=3366109 RepID=UPI003813D8B3